MKCISPFDIKDEKTARYLPVPCGKCLPCINRRINGWAFRLQQEERISESSNFLTLTYGTEHVPFSESGYLSTDRRDLSLFFKRLRKRHEKRQGKKIKYYAVSEYGDETHRPHYHIILFNAHMVDVEKSWRLGNIHNGNVEEGSIKYVTGYFAKQTKVPMFEGDDREKEFSCCSNGLGESYLTPKAIAWHKADLLERCYLPAKGGQKVPMPRYYKEKIYTKHELLLLKKHFEKEALNDDTPNKKLFENRQGQAARLKTRKKKATI